MGDIEGNLNRLFQMIIDKNASLTDGVKTET